MCFKLVVQKTDPLTFDEWKLSHVFKLNLSGSAGNMELIGPRACLGTLMTKNELRYTSFDGDGDRKNISAVKNAYPDITVQK